MHLQNRLHDTCPEWNLMEMYTYLQLNNDIFEYKYKLVWL